MDLTSLSEILHRLASILHRLMQMDYLCVALFSGILGATTQHVLSTHVWPNRHRTYAWWFTFFNHRKYGQVCEADLVLNRDGYSLGYSFKKKSALWVSYVITKNSIGVDVARDNDFYPDPDIPKDHRVKPEDFSNTGYDRGHLAPSASIDFSRKSNQQTFSMSNIVLQDPQLNRQAWAHLEGLVRKWTFTKGRMAVVTGPVYGKRDKKINDISVPKQFYQVIYSVRFRKSIGFVFPNEPVLKSELWKYAKSVEEIEKETGYEFFVKLRGFKRRIKGQLDLDFWQKDKKWNPIALPRLRRK